MKIFKYHGFLSMILSFFTVFCLNSDFVLTEPLWTNSGALLNLLLFAGIFVLYERTFFKDFKNEKGQRVLSFGLPFAFGLLMGELILLGMRYVRDTQAARSLPCFVLALLALALLFSALLKLLIQMLPLSKCLYNSTSNMEALLGGKGKRTGLKIFLIIYAVTGLFYFVTFLAVYPGIYSYDASVQVLQFFGDQPVTNHHPLLHTLFLCGSLQLGNLLFGSFQAGMAIHSVLQAAIMGGIFSYVIYRMLRERRPMLLVLIAWLFLVVNPYIRIFVFVTTKDVLFGGAFLLTFLLAGDMMREGERFFKSASAQCAFAAAALVMCFLRNQGIYVLLLFGVIYAVYLFKMGRKRLKRWLFLLLSISVGYLTVTGPVYSLIGVEKGDAREMLSVPMQQLARAYHEVPERLSPEETQYIKELILPEALEQYVSPNADPVKSGFQTKVVKSNPEKFIKTWFSIGQKAPLVYADSFFMGNWGYWYPEETQYWINYIVFDGAFLSPEYNVLNIRRNSLLPAYEEHLRSISLTPAFQDVPVLSVLLNQAFPFWLLLITAFVLLYFKKYGELVPLSLLFGYFGTLLLGPVTSVRYVLPLMYCVPALFCLLLDGVKNKAEGTKGDNE